MGIVLRARGAPYLYPQVAWAGWRGEAGKEKKGRGGAEEDWRLVHELVKS